MIAARARSCRWADIAHAQDLDCADFTYQEDAQTFFDMDRR
ncbi:hypothetical protein SALBM217S_02043 [Streptomyces griseoloalbus]